MAASPAEIIRRVRVMIAAKAVEQEGAAVRVSIRHERDGKFLAVEFRDGGYKRLMDATAYLCASAEAYLDDLCKMEGHDGPCAAPTRYANDRLMRNASCMTSVISSGSDVVNIHHRLYHISSTRSGTLPPSTTYYIDILVDVEKNTASDSDEEKAK